MVDKDIGWYAWIPISSNLYFYVDGNYLLTHHEFYGPDKVRKGAAQNSKRLMKDREAFFIPEELML